MNFAAERLYDDQALAEWRDRCRGFVEHEILPFIPQWEREPRLAWECYRKLAAFGYLRLSYPRRLGGLELSGIWEEVAMEELARAGKGPRAYLVRIARNYGHLLDDGRPEHQRILEDVLSGRHMLAFAETEAAGGSDAANIRTTAVAEGGGYRLTGTKAYISLVPGADLLIVTALTDPGAGGKRGMSLFLVPVDTPGVTIVPVDTPDLKAWHTLGTVVLRDVWAPPTALLGEAHRGFYHIKARVWSRRGLDHRLTPGEALAYYFREPRDAAGRKTVGGRPLLDVPRYQSMLIDNFGFAELYRLASLRVLAGTAPAGTAASASASASAMQFFTKVLERQMMMAKLEIEGGDAVARDTRVLQDMVFHAGARAAGGGVDIHFIIVGQELYGREWACHRD
ncbi:MAG: acyl-CoA/acyl-ACP dehydrogenase [Candidatus Rokubacteria bacterium]|nr:acyl-CoA/acyl-ACP dehydrogenase [Candidatus Rokubacteria bacterium]